MASIDLPNRCCERSTTRRAAPLALAAGLFLAPLAGLAQQDEEFAAFGVTDVDGALTLRHLSDSNKTASTGPDSAASRQERSTKLVASVSARGFVYHPNLVALEGGFGLIFQRSSYNSGAADAFGDARASQSLYDLSARVTVLRDKPYTGSLFYERLNPSVSVGPALVMTQETTRQGLQLSLLAPVTPIPVTLEAERLRTAGRGSGRVVDDQLDRYSLSADRSLGRAGNTRLRIDGNRLDSQSGSVGLPISRTSSDTFTAGLDTRLQLGTGDRYVLNNLLHYNTLSYRTSLEPLVDRRELRGFVDLRARHSDEWRTFGTAELLKVDQSSLHSHSRAAFVGATWTPNADLVSTAEGRSFNFDANTNASSSNSALLSSTYQRNLAGGKAQAAYAVRYDSRRQRATSPTTPVFIERHALAGTTAVALDRTRVVAGSVQVSNEARTQVFVEGRDYVLTVLGEQTRLERVFSGGITDGQTVLVDYEVETGGSFDSRQLDQSLTLFWSWTNRFSLSARWVNSDPTLTAGVPVLTLNTVRSRILRAQADLPLASLWSAGGSVEHEDRHETILPFRRTATDLYLQWEEGLLGPGSIRVGLHRLRVAYDDSLQDVDLTGYDVRYHVYTIRGIEGQADWTSDPDTGRAAARRRDFGSLRARWRFRQLLMTLSVTRAHESQDRLRTTRTVAEWLLRREF